LNDLDAEVDTESAWQTTRANINISNKEGPRFYKMKKHKPWFDEGCWKYYIKWVQTSLGGYRMKAR
jgi:hypothetical protein